MKNYHIKEECFNLIHVQVNIYVIKIQHNIYKDCYYKNQDYIDQEQIQNIQVKFVHQILQ